MRPNPEQDVIRSDKGNLLEAGLREPTPNLKRQVWRLAMSSPDDGSVSCAKCWQKLNRAANIVVLYVPKDAADQHEIRGNRAPW